VYSEVLPSQNEFYCYNSLSNNYGKPSECKIYGKDIIIFENENISSSDTFDIQISKILNPNTETSCKIN